MPKEGEVEGGGQWAGGRRRTTSSEYLGNILWEPPPLINTHTHTRTVFLHSAQAGGLFLAQDKLRVNQIKGTTPEPQPLKTEP